MKSAKLGKAMAMLITGLSTLAMANDGIMGEGMPGAGGKFSDFLRIDCRYHIVKDNRGAKFCYASAVYQFIDGDVFGAQLAVGCDNQTIYNDRARIQMETTLDRISPSLAATPAIEVFPHGQLKSMGTFTSELDIFLGRFPGLCYVHPLTVTVPAEFWESL